MKSKQRLFGQVIALTASYTLSSRDEHLLDDCLKPERCHGKRGKKGKAKKDWQR